MAAAEGEGIELDEPVQTLILPQFGDSKQNAWFRIRPLRKSSNPNDLATIRVRLYYEFNLLEVVIIKAEVVGKFDAPTQSLLVLKRPIWLTQERLERDYLDLNHVQPRTMHIDITRQENYFQFNFAFYNKVDKKIVFMAPVRLTLDDLESDLVSIRNIWYDIALSKSFSEHLEGDKDEFVIIMRRLASAGETLWVKLFRQEQGSALFQIGEWLKSHPLEQDAIIQVSTDRGGASFVFPWSLLYDRSLPGKDYEPPDPKGFWGMRYCIEQNVSKRHRDDDALVKVSQRLNVAFMLWDSFRNSDKQIAFSCKNAVKENLR